MPSQTCVDFENGIYHVYNRGVNKQNIFCDDQDRWYFIKLCKRAKLKYEAEFLAFCLMGNHYHLFVRTPKANLSKVMKHINERFSKYYINKYKAEKKSGHTFMGPYGRRIVQDQRYATVLLSYIHNNPLKDKFVEHPGDYKWSSYNYYAGKQDRFNFINKKLLEDKFVAVRKNSKGESVIDSCILNWEPDEHTLASLILGDAEFASEIYNRYFKNKKAKSLSRFKQIVHSKKLKCFIASLGLDCYLHRNILIYSLLEWSELQSSELEKEFKIKSASIRKIKSIVKKKLEIKAVNYLETLDIIKNEYGLY